MKRPGLAWPSPDWDRIGSTYRGIKIFASTPVKAICRLNARGMEHVPMEGGLVLACNHWSWWDPILVADASPRPLVHLAKQEVFKYRFTRWFFEDLAGQIPVDRQRGGNEEAIRRSVEAIEEGRVIAVYPEGTRSDPPNLLPGKTGVARLALLTGAPIVPVGCLSDRFWSKKRLTPKLGETTYVNIGEPIHVEKDPGAADDRDVTRKITDEVMGHIRRLLDDADAARARGERWPWEPVNGKLVLRE